VSHLDVGLAKRQTPCRFFETVQRFLPSFQGRWPFLIRRIRLQANVDIPEALVAGTSTPQGVLLFGLFRFEEAGGREKKKEKKGKKKGKKERAKGGEGFLRSTSCVLICVSREATKLRGSIFDTTSCMFMCAT